jgi:two-component system, chemotaxis family, chemotaxis protein CheY
MKILVVDDSKAMRMIVIRTFRQLGQAEHDFVEAENGADGLDKLRSEQPDLVISDWNMPEMSGIELLEAARAEGATTTFGFITSETATEFRERAIAAGAAFMLAKPFGPDALAEALGSVAA